ncbi:hypothetical protein NP493_745g00004 [Ridgeia piscesae]|uniref:Uncharacterized protein n=1 Tax=Ridgeia piscesae TaxID=27915 RepID=A0AAD9KPY1_RIDPI|nr:hypothetical protein NP493_745g00004 [Ridgeia piscesae]
MGIDGKHQLRSVPRSKRRSLGGVWPSWLSPKVTRYEAELCRIQPASVASQLAGASTNKLTLDTRDRRPDRRFVPPCSLALQPCARNRWPSGAGDNATRAAPAVEDSLGKRAAVGQTQAQIHTGHWTPDTVDRWPSKLQHLRRILDLSTPSQKLLAVVWLTTQIRGKIYVYFVVITSRVIGKARAERTTDRGMDSSRPGLSLSSSYVTLTFTFTPRTDLRTPVLRGAVDDMY